MARGLDRIWIRFGLWIAATVLVTVAVLSVSVGLFAQHEYSEFQKSLPEAVRHELDALHGAGLEDSPRAMAIYGEYWTGDILFGEKWSLVIGLLVCLPVGLVTGFMVSRLVTLPLASMAEAAQRVATGDFSVRAHTGRYRGELAEMVRHFNHMTDALEMLERERKMTAAAVSHELRTPLTVLRARLHALCDGVIAPGPDEFHTLLDQVEHLGRLVEDLHTLSLADAGRLSMQLEWLDLVPLVDEVLATFEGRLMEHAMTTEIRHELDEAWVHADRDRMRQVLVNLIENALRHAHDGGWLGVRVAADTDGRHARIEVSDGGMGLSEDARRHLFQRFMRTDRSRSKATGGSGLGLSIAHALVVRQGGTLVADASERGGARFIITMPLRPSLSSS